MTGVTLETFRAFCAVNMWRYDGVFVATIRGDGRTGKDADAKGSHRDPTQAIIDLFGQLQAF